MRKLAATTILTLALLFACFAAFAAAASHSVREARVTRTGYVVRPRAHIALIRYARCGAVRRHRRRHHHRRHRACGHWARIASAPAQLPLGTPRPILPPTAPTPGPNAAMAIHCDMYASPSGSDSAGDGSVQAPFASLRHLDQELSPGQTGCLRGGTYGDLTTWQEIATDVTAAARITLTSYPGETATVVGWVDVEAAYTTLENLHVDGSNTLYKAHPAGINCSAPASDPLTVAGHDDILQYLDYYQSVPSLRGNAVGVGYWGDADNTVIRYDKIHDVGGCDFYDHLIYLAGAKNAQIYGNWMWNDAHGWGIKLDPGPQNARIWGNVIDHAGSGFNFGNSSGATPTAGNKVFDNIVVDSVGVSNPDIDWSHPGVLVTSPGLMAGSTGNQLYGNDYFGNSGGESELYHVSTSQLAVWGNVTARPQFADLADHNYTLVNGSLPQLRGFARG